MITRLYANNFRCLVAFEAKFGSFGVLCANGAGKSSVFDVLRLIRNLATGDASLGSEGERNFPSLNSKLAGQSCSKILEDGKIAA